MRVDDAGFRTTGRISDILLEIGRAGDELLPRQPKGVAAYDVRMQTVRNNHRVVGLDGEIGKLDADEAVLLVEGRLDFPINVFALIGGRANEDNGARRAGDELVTNPLFDVIVVVAINFVVERVVINALVRVVEDAGELVVVILVGSVLVADENARRKVGGGSKSNRLPRLKAWVAAWAAWRQSGRPATA